MKQIVVISYQQDVDVSDGLSQLLAKYPKAKVLLPLEDYTLFAKSALKVILERNAKFHLFFSDDAQAVMNSGLNVEDMTFCSNPNREVMQHVHPYDVLALVWDDSTDAHITLHTLEDFGLESWDISNGLDIIEIDDSDETADELFEAVQDSMAAFVDNLSAYVVTTVLDALTQSVNNHIDEFERRKDLPPTEDLE